MTALPPAPGILRTSFAYQLVSNGSPIGGFRLFLRYTGTPPSASQLVTACTNFANAWASDLAPQTSTAQQLASVTAIDLSSNTGAEGTATAVHAGTRTGTELPVDVAVLVNGQISRRYRGGKPRTYVPGGVAADTTDGRHWTGAFQSGFLTAWQSFTNALDGSSGIAGGLSPYNVSFYEGFTVVTDPVTHRARNLPTLRSSPQLDPVIGYSINPIIGSQRRRLRAGS